MTPPERPTSLISMIGDRLPNLCFGLAFCALGILGFDTIENRLIAQLRALDQGALEYVSIAAAPIAPENEGRLVHLSGTAKTGQPLQDELLGLSVMALGLARKVQMYQWQEYTTSQLQSRSQTAPKSYRYRLQWSDTAIDHSQFRYPEGHENPGPLPFESQYSYANDARVGDFLLRTEQLPGAGEWQPLPAELTPKVPPGHGAALRTTEGLYFGLNPAEPALGDVRIQLSLLAPVESTFVAEQSGDRLLPYQTPFGNSLDLVEHGVRPAASLFQTVERASSQRTWLLRGLSFVALLVGIGMLLHALAGLAQAFPLMRLVLDANLYVVSFLLAALCSVLAVAASWFAYQPVIATDLLFIATAVVIALVLRLRGAAGSQPTT